MQFEGVESRLTAAELEAGLREHEACPPELLSFLRMEV